MPSCIAVSPEGIIRYWQSISSSSSYVEANADLQGQECDSLTDVSPLGCILATTTATIVIVQPQIINTRHVVMCRTLKLPQGWLGGISRRMSSLIFGSLQSSQVMETVSYILKFCWVGTHACKLELKQKEEMNRANIWWTSQD